MTDSPEAKPKSGVVKWFLSKFVKAPATWIGLVAGISVGIPMAEAAGNAGAGIGFGSMVGVAVAAISFLFAVGIKSAYEKSHSPKSAVSEEKIQTVLEDLNEQGCEGEAEILEKLNADWQRIQKDAPTASDQADAEKTLKIVAAIREAAVARSEELVDLVRRMEDPILTAPENAEATVAEIRNDLANAYRAVADARSRLRRGEKFEQPDFLADESDLSAATLSDLTDQLSDRTTISKRVEERLRPDDLRSGIVIDEPVSLGPDEIESETN